MIDWSVRFGDILVMVSFLVSAIIFAGTVLIKIGSFTTGFNIKMDVMQTDMKDMKDWQRAMQATLTAVAVQQSKLDAVDRRLTIIDESIDDIRHGRGFIVRKHNDD